MQLRLENFRRFHKPGAADIAPITILLGENSSGKTSFAAGLRYILDSFSFGAEGSFNREPYFLGAFDQIAHYRGGRAGRAKSFSISLRLERKEVAFLARGGRTGYINREFESFFDAKLTLENDKSQPTLAQVSLANKYANLEFRRSEYPAFRFKGAEDTRFVSLGQSDLAVSDRLLTPFSTNRNSLVPFYHALSTSAYQRGGDKSEVANQRAEALRKSISGFILFEDTLTYASAPFRTKPERTYSPIEAKSSAEGSHIPILLAQTKAFQGSRWAQIKSRLEKFGERSQMFKQIDVKRLGHNASDPFQIIITVSKDKSNMIDVGYGVSQIIPLLVEILLNENAKIFIFQQPEVHLHPRAQAELGSYLLDFSLESGKYLVLESHSDFMLDRIKADLISRDLDIDTYLSVLFFERDDLSSKISRIRHDKLGNVTNAPPGYRSFFLDETARNLGID